VSEFFDFDTMDPDWDAVPPEIAELHYKRFIDPDGVPTTIVVPAALFAEARRRQEGGQDAAE